MTNGRLLFLLLTAIAVCGGCTDTISGNGGSTATPPAAPANLDGWLQNSGKDVALSWVDSSGDESGFRVEVNTSAFGTPPYVGVFFVGANSPTYVYSAPLPNTTYYFRVYAITGSAQSDPSNVISRTSGTFPMPPQYFSALAIGPTSVELKWLNGSTDNGNIVERSVDQVTWTPIFNGPTGPNLQGIVNSSGLSPNTYYYYRGYAKVGAVVGDVSSIAATRTQAPVGGLMTASSGGGVHSSLAFDDFAVQRIVSYDVWGASLSLTTGNFPPSPYSTTTIGFGMGNGYHGCSVATDNGGVVFVASHVLQNDELQFISNQLDVGTFAATTIDSDPGSNYDIVAKNPVIRVSPTDQSIHIVYKVETTTVMNNGRLRHRWRDHDSAGSWSFEEAVPFQTGLGDHSFVIDGAGVLHIVYASQAGGSGPVQLNHARRLAGGGWTFEIITNMIGGLPDMNSVTVDPSNSLHVAYKDNSTGGLWYATDRTGSWTTEEVHSHTAGNLGLYNSIAYVPKPSADVHISYYEVGNGNLWYAGKKGANGTWYRKLIDSTDDVGRYTSIKADWTDIYITYFDSTNYRLKAIRNPQD